MSRTKRTNSLIKNIYYTTFLMCRHLTLYEGEWEAHAALLLVSFIMAGLGLTLFSWLGLSLGVPIVGRWLALPLGFIAVANYHLFVQADRGSKYGDEFDEYSELKQTLLCVAAIALSVAILVGTAYTAVAYRHAHGFPT